jgi:hypothetical protein
MCIAWFSRIAADFVAVAKWREIITNAGESPAEKNKAKRNNLLNIKDKDAGKSLP